MRLACLAAALSGCSSSPASAPPPGSGSGSAVPARYAALIEAVDRGDAPDTTSILVMRHGAIDFEHYWQSTAARLNDTRSATKTVTALAAGVALDAKLVPSLDAPAFAYLADVALAHLTAAKLPITIADLMTMSSALDCDDNDPRSPGNEENMYPQEVWLRWAADLPARADYVRDPAGRGPWHYCTAGTFLLG